MYCIISYLMIITFALHSDHFLYMYVLHMYVYILSFFTIFFCRLAIFLHFNYNSHVKILFLNSDVYLQSKKSSPLEHRINFEIICGVSLGKNFALTNVLYTLNVSAADHSIKQNLKKRYWKSCMDNQWVTVRVQWYTKSFRMMTTIKMLV